MRVCVCMRMCVCIKAIIMINAYYFLKVLFHVVCSVIERERERELCASRQFMCIFINLIEKRCLFVGW